MPLLEKALKNNTCWENITVADIQFTLKRVKDMDILLEAVSDEEFARDDRLPYWAEIWPSALALAEFILDNRNDFSGKRILEIGCGLGLVGLAATAAQGEVVFSDFDPYALEFTQINMKRNFNRAATVQLIDWREPGIREAYDIILGADILYEKRWLQPVVNVLDIKLSQHGIAYIAEPNRTVAKDFFSALENNKWYRDPVLKRLNVYNKLYEITINRIRRC
jgi:predicted nicotinamide N-methyase